MAYNIKLGYDPDKDYSALLADTNLSAEQRAKYTGERAAKIDHLYKGVEPTLAGSNMTYTQAYNYDGTRKADSNPNDTDSLIKEYKNLTSSGYTAAYNNAKKANDAAVNKAVNDLNAQKASTDQSYANLFRQLYLDKMKAKKNVNQQLASQGITGGMSESSLLGLDTSYGEALRQGEQERIRTQAELDKAITDTKLTGDVETANAALELAQRGTDSYAGVLQSLINRNDTLDYNKSVIERENDAIAREQENNERTNARSWAMTLLQNGIMPSSDVLLSAGINTADAQAVVDSVKAQQKSASSVTSTMSLTDARNALEAGYIDDNIRTVLKNNGWSDAYIDYVYNASGKKYPDTPEGWRQSIIDNGFADEDSVISAENWNRLITDYGLTEESLMSYGFEKEITDESELSPTARTYLSHIRNENGNVQGLNSVQRKNLIEAVGDGRISQNELDYIMKAVGIS
ncbi:MAG: hypothetical protein IKV53_07210 [Clostridia bacterium]|nr:hypothetical protein [Clostridia bacterium]